jgi:hypothetical protein
MLFGSEVFGSATFASGNKLNVFLWATACPENEEWTQQQSSTNDWEDTTESQASWVGIRVDDSTIRRC